MITIDAFKTMLSTCLGFEQTDSLKPSVWTRVFRHRKNGVLDCELSVDFEKQRFGYEEAGIDVGGGTTVSFAPDSAGKVQNENFVVFECVVRLLEKGYKACDIFLEKRHTLGHTQKSGRLDITVAKDGHAYLIIECKTAGTGFKKARKELFSDPEGKQLFSYWAQSRAAKWLLLYASDYDQSNNAIVIDEEIIRSHDDKNVELLAATDTAIALYKTASEATDAWRVWDETYHKETYKNLIFGRNDVAYNIGIHPLVKHNLRRFTQEDGFTNTFREILRHNAISDKENAFNKLLSLFICKFVDEDRCSDQEIVSFQYKDGEDDYYSLYERLLALFQIGMKDYLKEEVFYLENDYISKTLDSFTGKKRKALEAELRDKFQKTKMLSCQVFAFREVYNEALFLQNGKVLVEIVKLMQQYQFAYSSKEQLLGDLFENLLNQGFKQEAGQFFTPTPITRFVWNALPYERFLNCAKRSVPRVIDFACGSGHFLTEGIAAISDFYRAAGVARGQFTDADISSRFFGVEKDNRLAKVSKIALILNGALKGRIKASDGLEHNESFLGKRHSFDILVANPPYSVDSFKAHESVGIQKSYETLSLMSIDCSRIQNVFVERMEHLLKSGGVAAIVLPLPFLTNDESDTNKAREILLKNFHVRAIVEFHNKAFAQTNTHTVILFLEHFEFPPHRVSLLNDAVDAILSGEELSDWEDQEIFSAYLAKIGVSEEDYRNAMSEVAPPSDLAVDYFKAYAVLLKKGGLAKDCEKAAKENDSQKRAELEKRIKERFYGAIKDVERAKILAFALTHGQKTMLVQSPTDNDEQEKFLGYKFSDRRNSEGLSETDTSQLTNKYDRADRTKIAYAIKNAFADDYVLPNEMKHVKVVDTIDMLDFTRPYFDWSVSLSHQSAVSVSSKFQLVKMSDVINLQSGQDLTPNRYNDSHEGVPYITGASNFENGEIIINRWTTSPTSVANKGDLLITCKGTVGKMAYLQVEKAHIARQVMGISAKPNLNLAYLKYILEIIVVHLSGQARGMIPGIKRDDILNAEIPLPSLAIQRKIVVECKKVDKEYYKSRMEIDEYRARIADVFARLKVIMSQNGGGGYEKLSDICMINVDSINPREYPDREFIYVDIDAVNNGVGTFSTEQKVLGAVAPSRARRLARSGTTLISTVRPNLKGFAWVETEIQNAVYSTGFAILKSKNSEILLDKMIYCMFMYSDDLMEQMIAAMPKGAYPSINKNDIERFMIPVPALDVQKEIVAEVSECEKGIARAMATMDSAAKSKYSVLKRYGVYV